MNDPRLSRRYSTADAPRLREIRKRLDSQISLEEVDSVSLCVLLSRVERLADGPLYLHRSRTTC